jgi:hypothetical protein
LLLSFLLFGQVEALPRNARNLKRILKLLRVDIVQVTDILVERIEQPIVKLEPETDDHWTNPSSSDYLANPCSDYLANPSVGYLANPCSGYLANPCSGYLANPYSDYLANPSFGYRGNPVPGSDSFEISNEDSERKNVVVKTEGISIEEFCPGMSC